MSENILQNCFIWTQSEILDSCFSNLKICQECREQIWGFFVGRTIPDQTKKLIIYFFSLKHHNMYFVINLEIYISLENFK
jgi:hypothetical protein